MPRLTKRTIESAEARAKEYVINDGELPGFGLRIMSSGRKSFFAQYRIGVKTRRYNIGPYGIYSAETARTEAIRVLADVRAGRDPVGEKAKADSEIVLKDFSTMFLENYCAHRVKPRTKASYEQLLNDHVIPALGHLKLVDITKANVANLVVKLSAKKTTANRVVALLSVMFNQADSWGVVENKPNPCRKIAKYKENKHERYLTTDELRRLGEALVMAEEARLLSPYAVAAFKLLILTGARHSEILKCKWEYVDLSAGVIRLPDSKTGAKIIPLGSIANYVISGIQRIEGNPYIICSGHVAGAHINYLHNSWKLLKKWADLDSGIRIHDLRHTYASYAVNIGMTLPVIGKLLGHSQTQTTDRYAHLSLSPLLEAANKVNSEIGRALVVPMHNANQVVIQDAEEAQEIPLAQQLCLPGRQNIKVEAPILLTSKETMEFLRVKKSLLDYWRWRKTGPAYVKVGNSVRYKLEDLKDFMRDNTHNHIAAV